MDHTDFHRSRGWLLRYFRILIYLQRGAVQLLKRGDARRVILPPHQKEYHTPPRGYLQNNPQSPVISYGFAAHALLTSGERRRKGKKEKASSESGQLRVTGITAPGSQPSGPREVIRKPGGL